MCRFLCYMGPEVLLADLLYRPKNSLILQSYKSRERKEPLNGDGFGVGWYPPPESPIGSPTPCIFTSVTPAWNNQNLRRLSEHVKSSCFFAHVRAASPGMRVCETNCHPFQNGRYLWMHNGIVEGFWQIKRRLCESLPDRLYNTIEGTTDSEHAFAVFLNLLGDADLPRSASELGQALIKTIDQLEQWTAVTESAAPSYYNFAVTDGRSVAAIRYVSDPAMEPASLYYSARGRYRCVEGECQFAHCQACERSVVIASERLNENDSDWIRVAPNHVLTVNQDLETQVALMEIERHGSRVETSSLYRRGRQSNDQFHTR